ncbi:MAG: hypothetical protein IJ880_12445 [Bacilli bacterium]|nr:hypothetical protein [Bacilli bacterium]
MYNQYIIKYNNKYNNTIYIKNKLISENFFSNDKMQRLLVIFKEENNINTYISTEYTEDNMVRITLKQNYFKKFDNSIDPLDYYTLIDQCVSRLIDENLPEVVSIFSNDSIDYINIIRNNPSMLYTLTRPSAGIILISFM